MAWTEWYQRELPSSLDEAEIACSLQPPESQARAQQWSFHLTHSTSTPALMGHGGRELNLFIEANNLAFQLEDWRDIGRQEIIATPEWRARAEYVGAHGGIVNSWLEVHVIEHNADTREWKRSYYMADYYKLSFGPPNGYLFPFELEAWLVEEKSFHTKEPLQGEHIRSIPQGPPNLRAMGIARFQHGHITVGPGHPDPTATARERISRAIALDEFGKTFFQWWADREYHAKHGYPPAQSIAKGFSEITFLTP